MSIESFHKVGTVLNLKIEGVITSCIVIDIKDPKLVFFKNEIRTILFCWVGGAYDDQERNYFILELHDGYTNLSQWSPIQDHVYKLLVGDQKMWWYGD